MCKHPKECVRILYNSAADRPPAIWVCDACNASFDTDPNNPYPQGVRYTKENKGTKEAIRFAPGGKF
jgi:hypothetical protein